MSKYIVSTDNEKFWIAEDLDNPQSNGFVNPLFSFETATAICSWLNGFGDQGDETGKFDEQRNCFVRTHETGDVFYDDRVGVPGAYEFGFGTDQWVWESEGRIPEQEDIDARVAVAKERISDEDHDELNILWRSLDDLVLDLTADFDWFLGGVTGTYAQYGKQDVAWAHAPAAEEEFRNRVDGWMKMRWAGVPR